MYKLFKDLLTSVTDLVNTTIKTTRLGVNTDADTTNKVAFKSNNVLQTTENDTDARYKLNKKLSTNTASHQFQSNFQTKAEFGLIGEDNYSLKVSPDGSTFKEVYKVDATSGIVDIKQDITKGGKQLAKLQDDYSTATDATWSIDKIKDWTQNLGFLNPVIPIGTVMPFYGTDIPAGFLAMTGGTYSKSTYADLWNFAVNNALTTTNSTLKTKFIDLLNGSFKVPDLRGQFLRGQDSTGTVDVDGAARGIGDVQADELKAHTHTLTTSPTATQGHGGSLPLVFDQSSSTTGSTGGSETRPKNVVVTYIIRAINATSTQYTINPQNGLTTSVDSTNKILNIKMDDTAQGVGRNLLPNAQFEDWVQPSVNTSTSVWGDWEDGLLKDWNVRLNPTSSAYAGRSTDVPDSSVKYSLEYSGNFGSNQRILLYGRIPAHEANLLKGKKATVSFWYKITSPNWNTSYGPIITATYLTAIGSKNAFNTGLAREDLTDLGNTLFSLSGLIMDGTWRQATFTFNVPLVSPTNSYDIGNGFIWSFKLSRNTNASTDAWNVKLAKPKFEIGSDATTFSIRREEYLDAYKLSAYSNSQFPIKKSNYIMNGAMDLFQRYNQTVTLSGTSAFGTYSADRWHCFISAGNTKNFTWLQSTDVPTNNAGNLSNLEYNFKYSLRITSNINHNTAFNTTTSDELNPAWQVVEGLIVRDLKHGDTLRGSIWLKTNRTGGAVVNMYVQLNYTDGTWSVYPFKITIASTDVNSWVKYKYTVPVIVASNKTIANGNTGGLVIGIAHLTGLGSSFKSSNPNAWSSPSNSVFQPNVLAVNECWADAAGNYIAFTGVKLTNKEDYEFSLLGDTYLGEEMWCKRYYEKSYKVDRQPAWDSGNNNPGSSEGCEHYNVGLQSGVKVTNVRFKVEKRVNPALSIYDTRGAIGCVSYNVGGADLAGLASASPGNIGPNGFYLVSSATNIIWHAFHWIADADI